MEKLKQKYKKATKITHNKIIYTKMIKQKKNERQVKILINTTIVFKYYSKFLFD